MYIRICIYDIYIKREIARVLCWYYDWMRWEQNNTLDCSNISTIILVFIKLFGKAKNRNVHFDI